MATPSSIPVKLRKVNSVHVEPVKHMQPDDNRPIKGQDLFPDVNGLYANIFCVASKNSGKSTVIARVIEDCATTKTQIIAFVSTLYKDNTWLYIQDWCKKQKIPFEGHLSIMDGKDNLLQDLVDRLMAESEDQKEALLSGKPLKDDGHRVTLNPQQKASAPKGDLDWLKPKKSQQGPVLLLDSDDSEGSELEGEEKAVVPKAAKDKFRAPEYIIILDDLSTELRNIALPALLKKNRHFRCKIIVSSQYIDMFPDARSQIDYWLLWGRIVPKKLEVIYETTGLTIPYDMFVKLYETVTEQPYQFLYIDVKNGKLRRNFDFEFVL